MIQVPLMEANSQTKAPDPRKKLSLHVLLSTTPQIRMARRPSDTKRRRATGDHSVWPRLGHNLYANGRNALLDSRQNHKIRNHLSGGYLTSPGFQ
jgi:hypothetical protein